MKMEFDLGFAVNAFWEARAKGEFFPKDWHDRLTVKQAYDVQLGIIARRCKSGERQIGWKVGFTTEAVQRQFGFHEPVFGCVLDKVDSGHEFSPADLLRPGIEPEFCVQLKKSLPYKAELDQIWDAIEACYPALEIIEARGDIARHIALAIADNAQQKTVVLGHPVPLPPIKALAKIAVRVEVNSEVVATGSGQAVLGNPLNSIRWLAGKLVEFGRELRAGDLIMTGSCTRLCPIAPGDRVHVEFAGMGSVETSLLR